MIAGSVTRRYAKALFAIGEEKGTTLGLLREIQRVAETWQESGELRTAIGNPMVSTATRRRIWQDVLARLGVTPLGKSFFMLLFDRSRLDNLPGIAREIGALSDRKENRLRAEIVSATPLPEEVAQKIKMALQRRTGKMVVVTKREDPALLGGVVTRLGDLMYDGSLRTQLERIKESMLGRR